MQKTRSGGSVSFIGQTLVHSDDTVDCCLYLCVKDIFVCFHGCARIHVHMCMGVFMCTRFFKRKKIFSYMSISVNVRMNGDQSYDLFLSGSDGIVKAPGEDEASGLEAWRVLHARYEPRTIRTETAMMTNVFEIANKEIRVVKEASTNLSVSWKTR